MYYYYRNQILYYYWSAGFSPITGEGSVSRYLDSLIIWAHKCINALPLVCFHKLHWITSAVVRFVRLLISQNTMCSVCNCTRSVNDTGLHYQFKKQKPNKLLRCQMQLPDILSSMQTAGSMIQLTLCNHDP